MATSQSMSSSFCGDAGRAANAVPRTNTPGLAARGRFGRTPRPLCVTKSCAKATEACAAVFAALLAAITLLHAQSTAAELADAGWKALRAENPKRAAALFGEALDLAPDDPMLQFGAGAAAHAQGRQREAMARLERSLELRPQLTAASVLLGQIAFDEGDAALAIRTCEAALKYAPGNAALAKQIEAWRRETDAHRDFSDRHFDRFRVLFEGRAEESLAMRATAVFDSAFYRIGSTLGEYPQDTIVAVLYTEQQFRDITRAPAWSGGRYDGRIRIPVSGAAQDPELFERVLVHELAHAVIEHIAPRAVPAWLHEGLAQHFENADVDAARRRMAALGGTGIPLPRLERGFGAFTAAQAQVAYDESLLAVGVLFDRPGFGWVRLLHRLRDGASFREAIGFFGYAYDDLEAGWRR